MDAVQVCDVNTADNTSAIIFQMRLTQGDILPDNMTGFYWILIGKAQQWGSNFSTVTAETLVDYPIAVSQVLTILCAADQTDIRDAEYAAPGTVTDTNFIAVTFALFGSTHAQPYPYYWIMVGIVQQWGTEPGVGTYEYPIPYTSLCCGVITNRQVQKSNNATTAVNITLTEFTCSKTDGMGDYTFNWLSAGIQQWGIANTSGSVAQAQVAFNMPFSSEAFSVIVSGTQDNDATALNGLATATNFKASNVTCGSSLVDNRNTTFYWLAIGQQPNKGYLRSLYRQYLALYPP